ncbi:hypothetical protein T4C_4170 [Trichinella pseudospiralis]|uniref:Uncharacterized protein n=1 Tax=Trichinella pseudospiralis TaxID=6337 RepID=A0A0V1K137_TRIPS|nr:hypothetical protein T4C_4170 [Trichinella pseudospiralis]
MSNDAIAFKLANRRQQTMTWNMFTSQLQAWMRVESSKQKSKNPISKINQFKNGEKYILFMFLIFSCFVIYCALFMSSNKNEKKNNTFSKSSTISR